MIDILSYAHTRRFHTVPTIGYQTVAEHSGRVAMMLMMICENPSANLLKAALIHDLPECVTGDIPAPAKWRNPDLSQALHRIERKFEDDTGLFVELNSEEEMLLKFADSLECGFFCVDQMMLGNRNLEPSYHNIINHLNVLFGNSGGMEALPLVVEAFYLLKGKYENAIS